MYTVYTIKPCLLFFSAKLGAFFLVEAIFWSVFWSQADPACAGECQGQRGHRRAAGTGSGGLVNSSPETWGFYHGLMAENHKKTIGKWWLNGGLMGFNQQNGDFNGMYPLVI